MTPPRRTALCQTGRALAQRRWTSVITSAGVGAVLVAFAARLGPAAAGGAALFAAAAVGAAIRLALAEDRRWRRAFSTLRDGGKHAARSASTKHPA
jgi:hypothetical protein